MADEPRIIQATVGPYAGQRLTVSATEADRAIAEGWAIDPFAEPKEAKEQTEEERAKSAEAAAAGARRLRGEEEAEAGKAKGAEEHKVVPTHEEVTKPAPPASQGAPKRK